MNKGKIDLPPIYNPNIMKIIKENIGFVEKYVGEVDNISEEDDKQIMYKSLGSIVVSAIEALCKSLLIIIYNKCEQLQCKENCNYKPCKSKIANQPVIKTMDYLCSTRLLYVNPETRNKIEKLIDLRNYIHLSKYLEEEKQQLVFDKNYVCELLDEYYDFSYQYKLCEWYFNNEELCLKKLDDDGFKTTKQMDQCNIDNYYTLKLYNVCIKILHNQAIDDDDKWLLNQLGNTDFKNREGLIESLANYIYHYECYASSQDKTSRLYDILNHYPKGKAIAKELIERTKSSK